MTLLDELRAIDLSTVLNARAELSVSIDGEGIQSLVAQGAGTVALGELGDAINALRVAADSPAALLQPVAAAFSELAGRLGLDDVPLAELVEAVTEGAEIAASLAGALTGDLDAIGGLFGRSLGESLAGAGDAFGEYASVALGSVRRFRDLVDSVEAGLPGDPGALADFAIDALLPFPGAELAEIRARLDALVEAGAAIRLRTGRTNGLVVLLDSIAVAAAGGDSAAVEAGLAEVDRTVGFVVRAVSDDFHAAVEAVGRLPIAALADAMAGISETLRAAEEGILEFFDVFRDWLSAARRHLEAADAAQITTMIGLVLDRVEMEARATLLEKIDEQVEAVKAWLRDLFAHLPIRLLRAQISAAIAELARAIDDLDLEAPVREVRAVLDRVQAAVQAVDLGDRVREAIQAVANEINAALSGVISTLDTIKTAIESVAGTAADVLGRAAEALNGFKADIDAVVEAVAHLGIEESGQQVIDAIRSLREKAEVLVTAAPLPEPIRPLVEQVIDMLRDIDVEAAVVAPVRSTVAEFEIPTDALAVVRPALEQVVAATANLIPAQVIAEVEAEVRAALDEIRNFDPSALLAGLTAVIDESARFVEGLDPRPAVASVRGPFQSVLDVIDAAHPRRLLAPAIEAYEGVLAGVALPDPETVVRRTAESAGGAGTRAASAAAAPMRQLAPGGGEVAAPSPGSPGGSATAGGPPPEPDFSGVRPGDLIRFLGYVPARLREALAALDTDAAGDALRAIDRLTGGLARDVRAVAGVLDEVDARLRADLDALLVPVGEARLRAALGVQAGVAAGTLSVDLNGSLQIVGRASPTAIDTGVAPAATLAFARTSEAGGRLTVGAGSSLLILADALERCRLARLGDLDALLAALDPEPIAVQIDAFVAVGVTKLAELAAQGQAAMEGLALRIRALVQEFNPGAIFQRFLAVLVVLQEELDLLNPARLADELGEIHAVIRAAVASYDPAVFAEELFRSVTAIATSLRGLDPAALAGDLNFLAPIIARVEDALPGAALAGVGTELEQVGAALLDLDPAAMLTVVNDLPDQVVDLFASVVVTIKEELIALLESLQYATASASVSVSASASVG